MRLHTVQGFALASALLAGCQRAPLSGPPEVRLGRDECAGCGMLISEDRCSSALLLEAEGRRHHAAFDDIGCMLDYEDSGEHPAKVLDRFVHDYPTGGWVAASRASYLWASPDKLPTPMATGIVAFADRASAERQAAESGGDILDYPKLAEARREHTAARRGGGDKR